jgi:hypothetical protein
MGSRFKTYLFEYFHEGSWWVLEISAPTMDDAQARINKLPHAKPVGEMVAKIPARLGLIARGICWFRYLVFGAQ